MAINQKDFDNIPQELCKCRQWVCWKLFDNGKAKPAKIPYDPKTGQTAKANDSSTWGTFAQACMVAKDGKYDGIGFEFSKEDPFTGIDLDHCVNNGVIESWAQKIIDQLNSYAEYSPSGTGIHIYAESAKPESGCKKGNIEIYTKGRFLTITGKKLDNAPNCVEKRYAEITKFHSEVFGNHSDKPISKPDSETATKLSLSDADLINKAMSAKDGAKFKALWNGDTSGYSNDDSAADMALCGMLAFWTGKNHERIDLLFRQSGLMRDKWNERRGEQTYGDITISRAIEGCKDVYTGKREKKGKVITMNRQATSAETIPEIEPDELLDEANRQYDGFFDISNRDTIKKLVNYNCTDVGNAERFRDVVGNNFWYVPELGWFHYDGVRYTLSPEKAELAMIAITRGTIEAALVFYSKTPKSEERQKVIRHALSSEANSRIKSALEIAKSMLTKHYTEFDKNHFLLCVENGVIDLRINGEGFRKSRPGDLLHKYVHIKFDPHAKCSRWLQFLDEIFMGDKDLITFIQKAVGYTLTGLTSAQCFFILYGTGANGKSVFLTILQLLLGEFAISTSMDTFKDRHQNNAQIPNDLAALCGKRFVKSTELKEGTRLNEERIKNITGDESIQARFLHKEFFDFFPEFKVWLGVNHKPVIRGTDEAIWRRPKLIPFEAYFPPETRDENLLNTLKSELPGILLWAIDGCHLWQKEGLILPEKVKKATSDYREESDIIGEFLSECTIQEEGKRVKAGDLWKAYEKWCGGEADIKQTTFGLKVKERGFIKKTLTGYPFYYGIGLVEG